MERRKGSYSLNKAGTFTGRFAAIQVTSAAIITALKDTKNRESVLNIYIKDSSSIIPAGTILVGRDAAIFTEVTISSGAIDIIF